VNKKQLVLNNNLFNSLSFKQLTLLRLSPARRAGMGFATFSWKVAKKRNPNNPVYPVQINSIFPTKYMEAEDECQETMVGIFRPFRIVCT
jgi:hypothetical protein